MKKLEIEAARNSASENFSLEPKKTSVFHSLIHTSEPKNFSFPWEQNWNKIGTKLEQNYGNFLQSILQNHTLYIPAMGVIRAAAHLNVQGHLQKESRPAPGTAPQMEDIDLSPVFYHERGMDSMSNKENLEAAKDYLSQISKTDTLVKCLRDTVAALRSGLTSVSCELKPDKVQSSHPKNVMEATIANIIDLEQDINQHTERLYNLKREAFRLISRIPDCDQQSVLIYRYIQGMKWDVIACELGHEVRWVYRVHRNGLAAFQSVMNGSYVDERGLPL